MSFRRLLLLCLLALTLPQVLVAKKKKKVKVYRETDEVEEVHAGPVEFCVWDKDLVAEGTKSRHVLEHHAAHHKDVHAKNFKGPSLGYVTPWNGKGYDVARGFRCKLTHISPVWYQLSNEGNSLKFTGGHDVDKSWIADLRKPCEEEGSSPPRILPRFLAEIEPRELLNFLAFPKALILPLIKEVQDQGFDGLVLECWTQWASMGLFRQGEYRRTALNFITSLGDAAKEAGLDLILAAPPAVSPHPGGLVFTPDDWAAVRDHVTALSLMTYDYSHAESPGPNAPLDWVEKNLHELLGNPDGREAKQYGPKILTGLNFYGRTFAPSMGAGSLAENEAVLGSTVAELLQQHRPKLEWDSRAREHSFKYKATMQDEPFKGKQRVHTVWYPTLKSLHERLELANRYHAGVSVWELGQGMDYFLDLF